MFLKDELSELFVGDNYSKIIALNNYARIGCNAYVAIMQDIEGKSTKTLVMPPSEDEDLSVDKSNSLASKPQITSPNFYNVLNCCEISLDDDTTNNVVSNIVTLAKSGNHFMPLIEIAREYSNFVFVIATSIPYANNSYKFSDENGLCEFMRSVCKCVYKKMSVKSPLVACMYIRCYKKKVYLKVHFLNYVMDISNRVALMKVVNKKLGDDPTFTGAYPIRYNEFYESSTFPLIQASKEHYYWQLFRVFECRKSFGVTVTDIGKAEFAEKFLDNPAVSPTILSINNYTDKELYHRDVPEYKLNCVSFDEEAKFMKEVNSSIRIAYFDLVLRFLPVEYKKGIHMENIVLSLKLIGSVLLAKHHFMKSEGATEEEFYRIWNKTKKVAMMGYYANIVRNDPQYKEALNAFIVNEIEKAYYASEGKVSDAAISRLINCYFYGRYYSFEVVQKSSTNKIRTFEFIDEFSDTDEELLYKWREINECSNAIFNFMTEDMNKMFNLAKDRLNLIGANSNSKDPKEKALGKIKTKFISCRDKLTNANGNESIYRMYRKHEINCGLFAKRINADKGVLGVHNGILDLNLECDDPQPKLYTGYSPYVVTKCVNARWIPYSEIKANGKYIGKIKQVFKDIIPQKDARDYILFIMSTILDEKSHKMFVLMMFGWGNNGKSLMWDIVLCLMCMYGVKLSPKLITSDRIGGSADPEFMRIKDHRFGLIAETNKNDKLVASRLKAITEKVKEGRELFKDDENFDTKATIVVNSNYEMTLDDIDHGTTRRIIIYRAQTRFTYNPDPDDEHEKKIDPSLPELLTRKRALAELLSWLVHIRCKFHRKYKSDIFKVLSPTIEQHTNEYKCNQDNITKFIHQRLVIMNGFKLDGKLRQGETLDGIAKQYEEQNKVFSDKLKMETVTREYMEWTKAVNGITINDGFNSLLNSFKNSCIGKRIIGDGELSYLPGIRILERGTLKLEGEVHVR